MDSDKLKGLPQAVAALLSVKDHVDKTKEKSGKIPCQCGGELHFVVAQNNGHVHANCPSCGISFME